MILGITISSIMFDSDLTNRAEKILNFAKAKQIKFAFAESCTGGLLSALFTSISGSSKAVERGFVTYCNRAKNEMLGVKNKTLESFGAVSKETAKEMALGAIKNSQADVAISITGIAGPTGGSAEKPVGLVYIGFSYDKKTKVKKFNFTGNRNEIRRSAIDAVLEILENELANSV